jgi:hypothetical protein
MTSPPSLRLVGEGRRGEVGAHATRSASASAMSNQTNVMRFVIINLRSLLLLE